ncbi:MAG TPA: heme o synthase [Phycisphaerae bacterium]|nr:heme o synthase [Phycisphaerae bacterium]
MSCTTQMPTPIEPVTTASANNAVVTPSFLHDLTELAKIRLTAMVVITTLVGFVLGSAGHIHWTTLICTALGTWALAGSASALNQLFEITPDSQMQRTCRRPLPSGRLRPNTVLGFIIITALAGTLLLSLGSNLLVTLLGWLNLVIYAFIYTPLKRISTLNTLVGAICGGIPPMMGYAAATGHLGPAAWILATILFVWQIPHFLSLAWLYRDDYARAGFRMLPVLDQTGKLTCRIILIYSFLLIPLGLSATLFGIAGGWYAVVSIALGLLISGLAVELLRQRTRPYARRVFLASVIYLPLLLLMMAVDHSQGLSGNAALGQSLHPTVHVVSDSSN